MKKAIISTQMIFLKIILIILLFALLPFQVWCAIILLNWLLTICLISGQKCLKIKSLKKVFQIKIFFSYFHDFSLEILNSRNMAKSKNLKNIVMEAFVDKSSEIDL